MNKRKQDEFNNSSTLSPWITERLDSDWAKEVSKAVSERKSSSTKTVALIYKKCQEEVLKKIAESPGQKWKLNAIKEDLETHRNTSLTDWFAKEVIALAEKNI